MNTHLSPIYFAENTCLSNNLNKSRCSYDRWDNRYVQRQQEKTYTMALQVQPRLWDQCEYTQVTILHHLSCTRYICQKHCVAVSQDLTSTMSFTHTHTHTHTPKIFTIFMNAYRIIHVRDKIRKRVKPKNWTHILCKKMKTIGRMI